MTNALLAAINDSPLCRQIATFLMQNESAMDTVKGIATWWLQCDEMAAQAALDRLIACGVVTVRTLNSGVLYGFTQDPEIRGLLQLILSGEPVGPLATN